MDDATLERIAFENLPFNICALTGKETDDPVVMHRDLSDNWPEDLHDMRDNRLCNLLIVDREARTSYYNKIKNTPVVLGLSGGLDSTTVLHWCLNLFKEVHCVVFDYDQRHKIEIDRAKAYANQLTSEGHDIVIYQVDMSPITALAESALTRSDIDVPKDTPVEEMSSGDLPATWVPGRNIYFMTALAQIAFAVGTRHIAMGVNVLDYSGYPDCRPEFMDYMRKALGIGIYNSGDMGVHAPLMFLDKKKIIRLGLQFGVRYEHTHSCYEGVEGGCGSCDSCILRRGAFEALGMQDPSIKETT